MTALIWVLPSVCLKVCFEIALLSEGFGTLSALEWFIPSVYSDMCFKIALLYQGLDKLKCFFPSVCRAMNIKIVFCWEGIITLTALIWVLASVCLKVCFEIAYNNEDEY